MEKTINGVVYDIGEKMALVYGFAEDVPEYVEILAKVDGKPVVSVNHYAFCGCTSLISITIPNSVTSIGWSAFEGCASLTSIAIPDSVQNIGVRAFAFCEKLKHITMPDSVTSIDDGAFFTCTSLTSIAIPNSVTSIGCDAFSNTAYYNNQSNWKNNALYIDDCLISGERRIYSKDAQNYNTFSKTTGVYSIEDGTRIIADYAFANCESLTSITIPNSVTSIGCSAFYNCKSLESIIIPDSVAGINTHAFSGCKSLKNITIGNGVSSIGRDVFYIIDPADMPIVKFTGTSSEFAKTFAPAFSVKWDDFSIPLTVECSDGTIVI